MSATGNRVMPEGWENISDDELRSFQATAAAIVASKEYGGNYLPFPFLTFSQGSPPIKCCICLEEMDLTAIPNLEMGEVPCLLPCGHILGLNCTVRHFETTQSCPLCKTDLRHPVCGCVVVPKPVWDKVSAMGLPRTIPDGGYMTDRCEICTMRDAAAAAARLTELVAREFIPARDQYEQSRSLEDLKLMLDIKNKIDFQARSLAREYKSDETLEWA